MYEVTSDEAATQLPKLMERALQGETVLITSNDRETFRLVPVASRPAGPRKAGSAKGLFQVPADFDEPLEDFKEYTE